MSTQALIPSISIEALVAARDLAIQTFLSVRAQLDEAEAQLGKFGVDLPSTYVLYPDGCYRKVQGDERFEALIRKEVDREAWAQLFTLTNVTTLMDHATARELREKLHRDPEELPELTAENIRATMSAVHDSQGEYFEKCVETVFRRRSWDHKTNEPEMMTTRVIVNGMFYTTKRERQGDGTTLNHDEGIHDLEQVLLLLDGQAPATYEHGLRSLGTLTYGQWHEVPGTTGGPVMRVKIYRKGTTHIEILDQGLVDAMNRIFADRYPKTLPPTWESMRATRGGTARRPQRYTDLQKFYTPSELAKRVVEAADIRPEHRVLEPSAGQGALVRAAWAAGAVNITAIEYDTEVMDELDAPYVKTRRADFLKTRNKPPFDRIVMNPPFSKGREALHILHALDCLKPGGRLVSIASKAVTFRKEGVYGELSERLKAWGAQISPIEAGAFKESGTEIETIMIVVDRPAELG